MRLLLCAAVLTLGLGAAAFAQTRGVQEGESSDPTPPRTTVAPTPAGEIATTGPGPNRTNPGYTPRVTPNNDPATAPVQDGTSSQ